MIWRWRIVQEPSVKQSGVWSSHPSSAADLWGLPLTPLALSGHQVSLPVVSLGDKVIVSGLLSIVVPGSLTRGSLKERKQSVSALSSRPRRLYLRSRVVSGVLESLSPSPAASPSAELLVRVLLLAILFRTGQSRTSSLSP